MCVSSQSIIINKSSYTSRSRALGASTLAHRASNTRDSVASITTSNPFRGESLFASTGPAGQALSPLF